MTSPRQVNSAQDAPNVVRAPFPYFGGKSKVASEVWRRLGNVHTYVEPFAGSLAVLLARPNGHAWWGRRETVGDYSGFVVNFFRSVARDPESVAAAAVYPVTEADLTSRHLFLVRYQDELTEKLMSDANFYDPVAAGWWVWGISAWVGGEWCSGMGPWHPGDDGPGVYRKMPMAAGNHHGKGIHKLHQGSPPIGEDGEPLIADMYYQRTVQQFISLAQRLHRVRVTCGDWRRLTKSVIEPAQGEVTGIFLDPPYDLTQRRGNLYGRETTDNTVTEQVHVEAREWALSIGDDPRYRIAYCSYSSDDEDSVMNEAGWRSYRWSAHGGYGLRAENRALSNKDREVIWFSPHCLHPEGDYLFDVAEAGLDAEVR